MSSMELPLRLLPRSELRQTHDMARTLITNRPKRRGRQGSDGRSSFRTFVPVVLLGTCMVTVLYGNISFFAEKLYGAPAADPSRLEKERPAENFRADPGINRVPAAKHRSDGALPEPPVDREKIEGVPKGIKAWPAGGGEGGVEAHWDDDAPKTGESPTFNGWEEVEVIDALEEAGLDADAVATGGLSVSLAGKEGVRGESGHEEEPESGGGGGVPSAAAVEQSDRVEGSGEGVIEEPSEGVGVYEMVKGVAASSTSPTSNADQGRTGREGEGGHGDGSGIADVAAAVPAEEGVGGSAPATSKTTAASGVGGEENVVLGAAASSTPISGVEENPEAEQEAGGSTASENEIGKDAAVDASGDPGVAVGAAASSTIPLTGAAEENAQGSKGDGAVEENRQAEQEAAGSTASENKIGKGAAVDASGDPGVAVGAAASSSPPRTTTPEEQAQGLKSDGDAAGLPASSLELEALNAEGAERVGGGVSESKDGDRDTADVAGVLDGDAGGEDIAVLAVDFEGKDEPTVSGETHEEAEEGDEVQTAVLSPPALEPDDTVEPDAAGGGAEVEMAPNGAVRGSMECATTKMGEGADDIANIATWREVPGDAEYRGPWYRRVAEGNSTRYVTLEKDLGGFNNIRISLECAVAFAAATGRTFVIPAPFMIWNMNTNIKKKEVDLRDLFTFDKLRESGRVRVITMAEFIEEEAFAGGLGLKPDENVMRLKAKAITEYLDAVGRQYEHGLPDFAVGNAAFVMPRSLDERVDLEAAPYEFAKQWLYGRELTEYQDGWQDAKVIHWRSHEARLLAPFYSFVLHTDEVAERYYKRLLRDLVHFPEEVYCKASQIIALLQQEDPSGSFSSFHVRRNDFMGAYKAVDIKPSDMVSGSLDHVMENEVVYVATDEKDLSFFDPFREKFRVRFLSDYYERAGVSEISPNVLGMLEQVIASHGRTFTGCWFSTFTAYILRLRGHLNQPRITNFSYYPPKKTYHHAYNLPGNPLWATEWPFGWEELDVTGVPDATAP